ncbi:MAG: WD40 repeat domain-containing protein, partial [Saprospiraceae bacterium]|nr:WD40 repeat domain-containing protein [Saprospiraceae bacterium]
MWKTIFLSQLLLLFSYLLGAQKPVLVIPTGHSASIHAVSCSSDGKYFLTAGGDNLVKIWNSEGQEIRTFKPVDAEYRQAQLSPDGTRILAAYCQESTDAWILNALTGEKTMTLKGLETPLKVAKYAPDGQTVITADEAGMLSLWNTKNGKLLHRWQGHDSAVLSLCFSPDGKYLATNTVNGITKIWDAKTGVENQLLSAALMKDCISVTGFSPDGKTICGTCKNIEFEVALWSMEARQKIATTHGYNCFFSPDGANICVLQFNGAAILPVEKLSAVPLQHLVAPLRPSEVAIPFYSQDGLFLPDGKSLLLYADSYPVVYDVLTSKELWAMKGYAEPIQCVTFSPDGTSCLVGSRNDIVDWDLREGQVVKRLTGHGADVRQVRYAPDGQKIVSVGNDYVGRVWEAASGNMLFTATGMAVLPLQSYAGIMAISPDGQYFVKGHSPGWQEDTPQLSLWNLSDGSLRSMIGENKD